MRVRVTARVKESRRFVQRRTCHPGCTPRRRYRRRRTQSSRAPLSAPACAPRAAPRARCLGSLGTGPRPPPSCRRGHRLQKVPAAPTRRSRRETRGAAPPAEVRSGCREGRGEECAEGAQRVRRGRGEGAERARGGCGEGAGRARGGRLLQRAPSLHCGLRELQRRHGLHSLHAIGLRVPLQWPGSGVREGGVEVTARACRVCWV